MPSPKYLLLASLLLTLACGGGDSSSSKNDAGKSGKDAGSKSARDSGLTDDDDDDDGNDIDGDGNDDGVDDMQLTKQDGGGGGNDAGFAPIDMADVPLNDAGVLSGSGSCCTAHDTPGCNNADLMVCVCEKLPGCCTTAWTKECTFIVEGKYCQEGVRDCVCGTADGQWGQTKCCDTDWSATCDTVAKNKCEAVPGCF